MRGSSRHTTTTLRRAKRDLVSDWNAWTRAEKSMVLLTVLAVLATPVILGTVGIAQ